MRTLFTPKFDSKSNKILSYWNFATVHVTKSKQKCTPAPPNHVNKLISTKMSFPIMDEMQRDVVALPLIGNSTLNWREIAHVRRILFPFTSREYFYLSRSVKFILHLNKLRAYRPGYCYGFPIALRGLFVWGVAQIVGLQNSMQILMEVLRKPQLAVFISFGANSNKWRPGIDTAM